MYPLTVSACMHINSNSSSLQSPDGLKLVLGKLIFRVISLGKIFLGRSAIREVTDKRLPQLNGYLKVRTTVGDKETRGSCTEASVEFGSLNNECDTVCGGERERENY